MFATNKRREDYTVGWVSALPLEMAAAVAMLDERHDPLQSVAGDDNVYQLGQMCGHNVVIVCLPSGVYGTTSAAAVASNMRRSFPNIVYGLMVGIAGGAPQKGVDIRLGDIVVGHPTGTEGGVVQYDYGKILSGGKAQRTGMLNKPPPRLLTAVATLRAKHAQGESQVQTFLEDLIVRNPTMTRFSHPGPAKDRLFKPTYEHTGASATCSECKQDELVVRHERPLHHPAVVHYGLIASGNRVIKDGPTRDKLAEDLGVYCFEMEAAGLVDHFPCLTIRGICDYCDSHKNKEWQEHAAAAAAAYAKDLLSVLPDTIHAHDAEFKVNFDLGTVPVIAKFVGRRKDLEKLWSLLQPQSPSWRKVVIMHGLGGIGKTQLALHFARTHKEDYTAIFWLDAKDKETLSQSFATTVRPRCPGLPARDYPTTDEEIKEHALEAQTWLAKEGNSRWLLVLDGVEEKDSGYNVQDFFPRADHGAILLCTRASNMRTLGAEFRLGKLENDDSLRILAGTSDLGIESKDSYSELVELSRRLDGLPLALVLARSYMEETGTSPHDYLEMYSQSWRDLQEKTEWIQDCSSGNLMTTWKLALDEIQQKEPSAACLFLLLSCYNHNDIWYELLQNGQRADQDIPSWLKDISSSRFEFARCMKALLQFSLVESSDAGNSYSLHPVVHDWCRDYLLQKSEISLVSIALVSVGFSVPADNDASTWALQKRLLPHADQLFRLLDGKSGMALSSMTLTATRQIGNLYLYCGKYDQAECMYKKALDGYATVGASDSSALNALDNLGLVYSAQGRFSDAEAAHFEVLRQREEELGPNNPSTLTTIHHLGALYAAQGKLEEAIAKFLQALDGRRRVLGVSHTSTMDTMNKLANVYLDLGNLLKAQELYENVLSSYSPRGLHSSLAITDTMNNLGLVYLKQGDFAKAEKRYLKILEDLEQLAPDHSATFNAIDNLGLLYSNQGKYEEAEKKFLYSLAGRQRSLGTNHASVFRTMDMLGTVYMMQGRLGDAERTYSKALEGARELSGLYPTLSLDFVNNLGNLHFTLGKYGDAEGCFLEAKNGYERVAGRNHTSTLDVVVNLGIVYRAQGKYREAESMYTRAADGYRATSSSTPTSTIDVMNNLGILHFEQGRFFEAEKTLRQATSTARHLLGRDHPSTLETLHNLGFALIHQGKFEEADERLSAALEGRRRTVGYDHQFTLDTLNNMGCLRRHQGRFSEAEEMHQTSLQGLTQALGPDHTLPLEATHNLGVLYYQMGRMQDAARMCREALSGLEHTLGPSHISTMESLLCLANVLREQGDIEGATQSYTRVITTVEETLAPNHPFISRALGEYAKLLGQEGKIDEAERVYTNALRGLELSLGSEHIYAIRIEARMAELYETRGNLKRAKTAYSRAHQAYRRALGPDHKDTMDMADRVNFLSTRISQVQYQNVVVLASIPILITIAVWVGRALRRR
ncbi:hypothetical protein BJX68DRAFT_256969 [Aspergillus pseudodeflectus]|uniref:TPR-like protein n=1 Tax=Aspergillus pseudodeflectus TaxID=176178 RepID=A0ABR4K0T0_9EURO